MSSKNKNSVYFFDYAHEVSLELEERHGKVIPHIEYLGINTIAGQNIIDDLKRIASIEKDENGNYKLYLQTLDQKECFACFKAGKPIVLDTMVAQKHLTSFEMRLLARDVEMWSVFRREEVAGLCHQTDLHTHFAAALSAEDLIAVGLKHQIAIPARDLKQIGVDVAAYPLTDKGEVLLQDVVQNADDLLKYKEALRLPLDQQETFNKMEQIYDLRDPFMKNSAMFPDILRLSAEAHAKEGIKYVEFSLAPVIKYPSVILTLHRILPQIEKETGCKIRFLAAIGRHLDDMQKKDRLDAIKSISESPYIVGADFMGHETNPTSDFAAEIKELVTWAVKEQSDFVIRVHAGENPIFQDNVKDVLKIVKQTTDELNQKEGTKYPYPKVRIGHGLYGVDEETVALFKELGAVVEFNVTSNLSLNNIDELKEVPLKKYVDRGINCVLGSDGMGLYATTPEQDVILAHAMGISREQLVDMLAFEDKFIAQADKVFMRRKHNMVKMVLAGKHLPQVLAFEFDTEQGIPRYNKLKMKAQMAQEREQAKILLNQALASLGVETDEKKIARLTKGKVPILVTGASKKAWSNISPKQQKEVALAMQVLANVLNPDKAYILTGGTNFGVEKEVHEAVFRRNHQAKKKLAVIGTFTEEALKDSASGIEPDTITHAIILAKDGQIAKRWFDLPDMVLGMVKKHEGEVIAVGGGSIVRDMIQRSYNLNIGLHLMNGPEGASTDKAQVMPEYAFEKAKGLVMQLYQKQPEIFNSDFKIEALDEYICAARKQIKTPAKPADLTR